MTWCDTNKAAEALDLTAEKLRKLKRGGWLEFGTHYRSQSSPNTTKPRLQFNPEKIEALLSTERRHWKNYLK